jgi:hypothetical protein
VFQEQHEMLEMLECAVINAVVSEGDDSRQIWIRVTGSQNWKRQHEDSGCAIRYLR